MHYKRVNLIYRYIVIPIIAAFINVMPAHTAEKSINDVPDSDQQGETSENNYVVAPLVLSAPAFGNALGVMGMYFLDRDSSNSAPPSNIQFIGAYSDTDSHFLGFFNQNFLKNDTLRSRYGVANGKINNDFDIPDIGNVLFSSTINAVFARLDRKWADNIFLGVKFGYSKVNYSPENDSARDYFNIYGVEDNHSGQFGVIAVYDSRDDIRFPSKGALSELSVTFVPEWLGSEQAYEVVQVFVNHYDEKMPNHILALRFSGRFTPEDTPYVGLSTLGQRSDLRGYTSGEIVAENLLSSQAEYRWMYAPKWGLVGFAGVASLFDGGFGNINDDRIYYSGGIGLRYQLHKKNKVNFRIDFAWGEDDNDGYYVSMSEAF